jgi:thiosulfate dehydrogenase
MRTAGDGTTEIGMKTFIIGVLVGFLVLFPLVGFLYVKLGFMSLATTAKPFPFEEFLARTALHASIGKAKDVTNKLLVNDENLLAGAKLYRGNCAVCHGLPGQTKTHLAAGMFPKVPQLFEKDEMVTDDPEGETFWKVSHGIRLSGMPGFSGSMQETERWQVTMLLKHADKLPAGVQSLMKQAPEAPR